MGELPAFFPGRAPIFALPNVVFFPGTRLPLHVFEPRYREMTKRALSSDRLIAVALLRPGWEQDYEGNPPIHEIATLGQIIIDQELPGGRFNIVLEGLARFRPEELVQETPYRIASGKLLHDAVDPLEEAAVRTAGLRLSALLARLADEDFRFAAVTSRLTASAIEPGRMADIVASALDVDAPLKQRLLEAVDVRRRLEALTAALGAKLEAAMRKKRAEEEGKGFLWN